MQNAVTIIILALTVEALVEYAKLLIIKRTINWKQLAALALSISLSLFAGTDLYASLAINFSVPYVGTILTGILFSRGANYIADFAKKLQEVTHYDNN